MAWLLLGILIWGALMFLVTPLLRKTAPDTKSSREIRDYKDEIARLEAEIAAGGDRELSARRIDLQRQLLILTRPNGTKKQEDADNKAPSYMVINALFAFFIFGGIGLYAMLGSPDLTKTGALQPPARPAPQSTGMNSEGGASIDDLVRKLEVKLSGERKSDPNGWMLYARTLMNMGRFEPAFDAYEKALALTDNNAEITGELARAREYSARSAKAPQDVRGPSAEDMDAAADMNPQDRSAMIENMVSGLAARLRDNPDNPEGWSRLIRARGVLGQTTEAEADITLMRETYASSPETVTQILAQAGWPE